MIGTPNILKSFDNEDDDDDDDSGLFLSNH